MSSPSNVEDVQDVPGALPQPESAPVSAERPGTQDKWNDGIDKVILQHLQQVKSDRNSSRDTFSAAVWSALGVELVKLGHPAFMNADLKDRLRILKKQGYTLQSDVPSDAVPPSANLSSTLLSTIPSPNQSLTVSASLVPVPLASARPAAATDISASAPAGQTTSGQANWTADAEYLLIEHLCASKEKGLMSENNFKNKVYASAAAHLVSKGHNFTKNQVKSRWTRFKAQFKIVAKLRSLSGFGWDPARSMVTATDQVWEAYLKGHPKARPFRKNPFPHYDDIAAMIGHSTATGALALSSENSATNLPGYESDDSGEDSSSSSSSDNEDDSDQEPEHVAMKTPVKRTRPPTSSSAPSSKRVRVSAGAQALESMSSSVAMLTQGITSGAFMAPPLTDSPAKKEKAFQVVRAEEGLSPYSLSKARRVFRGSGEVAREYLSFNSQEKEARHFWLLDEMEQL